MCCFKSVADVADVRISFFQTLLISSQNSNFKYSYELDLEGVAYELQVVLAMP